MPTAYEEQLLRGERSGQHDAEFGSSINDNDPSGDSGSSAADAEQRRQKLGSSDYGQGDYSSEGAERRQRYEEWARQHNSEGAPNKATTFINPGSADYGRRGGVDLYRNIAIEGGKENDALQAGNSAALQNSLANMRGVRGPQSVENQLLSSRADATRNQQLQALGLSAGAAAGLAPSEADFRTRLAMNDMMGARAGVTGSARGLAGLSGAQMTSSSMLGDAAGEASLAGGLGRSKEIGQAIGLYGSQSGAVRGQDLTRLGVANQNAQFNVKNADDWRLGNAGLAAAQGGLGVQYGATDLGWMNEQMSPAAKQFQYDQEMAAIEAGADADQAAASIARARESRENTRGLAYGGVTAGLTAIGSLGGPAGAAGGAAAGGAISAAGRRYY